jgi:hypothetical protein
MTTAVDRLIAEQVSATIRASGIIVPDTGFAIDESVCTVDYLPRFEPDDLVALKIVVAPRSRSSALATRSRVRRELAVQIGIMQKCDPGTDLFNALMDLTGDIDDTLARAHVIAAVDDVIRYGEFARSDVSTYDIAALEQHGVYRAVITATYNVPE